VIGQKDSSRSIALPNSLAGLQWSKSATALARGRCCRASPGGPRRACPKRSWDSPRPVLSKRWHFRALAEHTTEKCQNAVAVLLW
jgi:hypothetical protein